MYKWFTSFKKSLYEDAQINRLNFLIGGLLAFIGHPFYWLLWTYIFPQPYDSIFFRFASSFLGFVLIILFIADKKSLAIKRLLSYYWYFFLMFVLPITFTYIGLKNEFSGIWLICETMMLFFLVIFIYNWLLLLANLILGVSLGYFAYILTTENLLELTQQHIEYLLVAIFVLIAGILFGWAERKGFKESITNKEHAALAEQALRIATEKAHSIAHEMRNSLGGMFSGISLAEKFILNDERNTVLSNGDVRVHKGNIRKLRLLINSAHHTYERAQKIIGMLLRTVSSERLNESDFTIESIKSCVNEAVRTFPYNNQAESSRINVQVIDDFQVYVERDFLVFSLFNLIKNALYYLTDYPDLNITITTLKVGNKGEVRIKDTGPGIPQEKIQNLFKGFTTDGKKGGTGLGLAFSLRSMQSFDGKLSCNSEEGKYTEFVMTFPLADKEKIKEVSEIKEKQASHSDLLINKKILVVDDQSVNRKVLRSFLESHGSTVSEAVDGLDAIEKCKTSSFDAILMDLNMPNMDGFESARTIRKGSAFDASQCQNYKILPIIAVTSKFGSSVEEKVKQCGMDGFLPKGHSKSALLKLLAQTLKIKTQVADNTANQQVMREKLANKVILLAEDNQSNRMIYKRLLKTNGLMVHEAQHGQDAIEVLDHFKVDAVLMDIEMPIMNGIAATRAIREGACFKNFADFKSIPIIALTGRDDQQTVANIEASGMNAHLVKPLKQELIMKALYDALFNESEAAMSKEQTSDETLNFNDIPLLNTEKTDELRSLDEDILTELVPIFVEESKKLMQDIEQSFQSQDMETYESATHTLKGSAGNIGAERLFQFMKSINDRAKDKLWPENTDWLAQLKPLYQASIYALEKAASSKS